MYIIFWKMFLFAIKKNLRWHVVFNVYDKNEFIPYSSITGYFIMQEKKFIQCLVHKEFSNTFYEKIIQLALVKYHDESFLYDSVLLCWITM